MDENATKDDLVEIDNIEVEPLSDDSLDSVAGGYALSVTLCSCQSCSHTTDVDLTS